VFFFVALLLLLLLPSPWNVVGFVAGLVAFGGEVVFWNRRVRGKKVATGADTFIGESAVVVSSCRPDGQVRLRGLECPLRAGSRHGRRRLRDRP
jgi:membrane-bound ClpP family serine protease